MVLRGVRRLPIAMTASWLQRFLTHADVSTSTLRATLWLLALLDVRSGERAAIAHELAVRAWAEAIEARLGDTIAWCRGGVS